MRPETRRAGWIFAAMCAFALLSWTLFRGYLTPEMMIYFLSFKWCF